MKNTFLILLLFIGVLPIKAQDLFDEKESFTKQDSLRGSITAARIWWDLTYYHLEVEVVPDAKFI